MSGKTQTNLFNVLSERRVYSFELEQQIIGAMQLDGWSKNSSIRNGYMEQLRQFLYGPVWDGNIISNTHTESLRKLGYVSKTNGYNFLTTKGIKVLVELGILTP